MRPAQRSRASERALRSSRHRSGARCAHFLARWSEIGNNGNNIAQYAELGNKSFRRPPIYCYYVLETYPPKTQRQSGPVVFGPKFGG